MSWKRNSKKTGDLHYFAAHLWDNERWTYPTADVRAISHKSRKVINATKGKPHYRKEVTVPAYEQTITTR